MNEILVSWRRWSKCKVEPCFFHLVLQEVVYLLIVYLENILILALEEEIQCEKECTVDEFHCVTLGEKHFTHICVCKLKLNEGECKFICRVTSAKC